MKPSKKPLFFSDSGFFAQISVKEAPNLNSVKNRYSRQRVVGEKSQ